jgi:nucleoside-diphosphate-sugar epimerase
VKVLVVGGTRFVGYDLVWRLLASGHDVTVFNRGRLPDPFGMSLLDPARAREDLGFEHRPMVSCLQSVVSCFLAHPPSDRPAAYAGRSHELELARHLG